MHRVNNLAGVADRVVKFNLLGVGWLLLTEIAVLDVGLGVVMVSRRGLRKLLLAWGNLLQHLLI